MNKNDVLGKYELIIDLESDGHPTCPIDVIKYTLIKQGYEHGAIQKCMAPNNEQFDNMSPIDYFSRLESSVLMELFILFRSIQIEDAVKKEEEKDAGI